MLLCTVILTSNDHTKSVKYLLVCFEGELPIICTNTVCSHGRILIIKLHFSVLATESWKVMTSIKCRQRPFPGCTRLFYCELASFFLTLTLCPPAAVSLPAFYLLGKFNNRSINVLLLARLTFSNFKGNF